MLNLLVRLGFLINVDKSNLTPNQSITYIGGLFKLDQGIVLLTLERVQGIVLLTLERVQGIVLLTLERVQGIVLLTLERVQGIVLLTMERVQGIISAVHSLMNGKITARHYLYLLGKIASCLELIPNARLFMRPIQLHLLENCGPSKRSLEFQIPCIQKLKAHLKWWLSLANITQGRSLILSQQTVTITTDASLTGWGGHMKNRTVQGLWTEQMKLQHINNLEL
jgi:hypothetical protein